MVRSEITITDFETYGTGLKSIENCIVVLMLPSCETCKAYMAKLDEVGIAYKYLRCITFNMELVTRIAKQLGITQLSVPIVLKYKNRRLVARCSNKIADIATLQG